MPITFTIRKNIHKKVFAERMGCLVQREEAGRQVGAPLGRAREFELSSERSGKVTKPKSVLDFSSASQNHHETPVLPVLSYWVPSSSDPSSTVP